MSRDVHLAQPVQRLLSAVGGVATAFTTACCLGVAAAVSFASSIGATFLTRDSSLRPALIVTLAVSTAGAALTYWRHRRNPIPLLLTVAAGVSIYSLLFVYPNGGAMHDHMADAATHVHQLSTGRQTLVWAGLAVLVAAQVWDYLRVRRARLYTATVPA